MISGEFVLEHSASYINEDAYFEVSSKFAAGMAVTVELYKCDLKADKLQIFADNIALGYLTGLGEKTFILPACKTIRLSAEYCGGDRARYTGRYRVGARV